MSVFTIACPECKATLKSSKPIAAGKIVTCPKCSVMFPAPAVKPRPVAVPAGVDVVEEDDEYGDIEIIDDAPKKKEAAKPMPKPPGARKSKRPKKSNTGFIIGLCAGLVGFAAFVAAAFFGVRWLLQENNDPVAYMPQKPMMLVSADMSRIFDSQFGPMIEPLLSMGPLGAYFQDAGSSPKASIDRVAFSVGHGSRAGVPGAISVAVVGKTGFDKQKVAKAFGATPQTFGGRSVFQSGSGAAAQTFVFTSKLAAMVSGPPGDAEDVVRTAGRNSPPSLMADMVKRVSGGHVWFVMDPKAFPHDNQMLKSVPKAQLDAIASCRSLGVEANLSGEVLEIRSIMLMDNAKSADAFVADAKKAPDTSGAAFGINPTEPPTVNAQGDLVIATMKLKTGEIVTAATALSRMASMFAPAAPAGGRGGR